MSDINKIIQKLFSERWTKNLADAPIEDQREQLFKTLTDQAGGYWSGHTAYHLAVDGGFLIDSDSGSKKKLTTLGEMFMESMKIEREKIECWSCGAEMTLNERSENDGDCPYCGSEIELDIEAKS